MDGKTLKLRRVSADLRVRDMAAAMGVSDSRISRIENSRVVTDDAAHRYVTALATLTTNVTDATSAA